MQIAELVDDDGVLVLASAQRLEARFGHRDFDYGFPKELVAAAADEVLCTWQSHAEGRVVIAVAAPEGDRSADAVLLGVVRLERDDDLLLLPYSQFTMACDYLGGVPEEIEGLQARLEFPAGRYAVSVRPAGGGASGPAGEVVHRCEVHLAAAGPADMPLSDVPVVEPWT
ncbi:MAG: hypothetical protein AVDCRST_MAG66-1276 [uncultured Pseudonocardia sp.]|uniref:Uncharacterized protein n=1 Tax=uncultured Pseudonocardia sp. TaxID=211455 RepID=A0A6J4NXX3_9PSEU|nr:MAG: hypothetical protein AVDCRST_MAG66-1276 [uncultured Pseudonocardia sp.]